MIPSLLFINNGLTSAEKPNWSKVVFFVGWYDVGKEVLEGLRGVKRVKNGFSHLRETNTVWYNPAVIDVDEMAQALKDAGTYLGTEKWSAFWGERVRYDHKSRRKF